MNSYRVRIFITNYQWTDSIIHANSMYEATQLGRAQSMVGKAICLCESQYY